MNYENNYDNNDNDNDFETYYSKEILLDQAGIFYSTFFTMKSMYDDFHSLTDLYCKNYELKEYECSDITNALKKDMASQNHSDDKWIKFDTNKYLLQKIPYNISVVSSENAINKFIHNYNTLTPLDKLKWDKNISKSKFQQLCK